MSYCTIHFLSSIPQWNQQGISLKTEGCNMALRHADKFDYRATSMIKDGE